VLGRQRERVDDRAQRLLEVLVLVLSSGGRLAALDVEDDLVRKAYLAEVTL
jgi:hypothetical protein